MTVNFVPKERKKNKCLRDSIGAPQKQGKGTFIPKEEALSSVEHAMSGQ